MDIAGLGVGPLSGEPYLGCRKLPMLQHTFLKRKAEDAVQFAAGGSSLMRHARACCQDVLGLARIGSAQYLDQLPCVGLELGLSMQYGEVAISAGCNFSCCVQRYLARLAQLIPRAKQDCHGPEATELETLVRLRVGCSACRL